MSQYHKIQTLFKRDPATNHRTLLEGQYARPEFEYLKDAEWVFTEKVDGTNIRIIWQPQRELGYEFRGKTDRAQIPPFLLKHLDETFSDSAFDDAIDQDCAVEVVLYGEGYGAKIQKGGGNYIPDGCGFILFDVRVGDIWLERHNVEDIAEQLSIPVVPIVGRGPLREMVEIVRQGEPSRIAKVNRLSEGLVARPACELMDRRGQRVITKLKHKDFPK